MKHKKVLNKNVFPEESLLRELTGGKIVFCQRFNSRILSQTVVRVFLGSKSGITGGVTLS